MTTRLGAAGSGAMGFWPTFFLIAALYDGILGAAFFFFYSPVFHALGIALPNNTSYIHLTAGFIFVQGVGYWFVSRNPLRNIDLVKAGVIYKAVYSGLAIYYLIIGQLLSAVFVWFAVFDLIFLVMFARFIMQAQTRGSAR